MQDYVRVEKGGPVALVRLNSPEMAAAGENFDPFARGQYTLMFAEEK